MDGAISSTPARPRLVRNAALAVGNVLLGAAVGLACYEAVSGIQTRLAQDRLRSELGIPARVVERSAEATSPFDFEGWADQDLRYWEALREGGVLGRLVSEPMRLDAVVVKGTGRSELKKGPGWITWTDLPGPTGNVGIAGHRTTFGAPFRDLERLAPGDTIDLYSPFRRYRYEVVEILVVTPNRTDVAGSTAEPMLTLTACHPPYSARYRLVVRSELVEVVRFEGLADRGEGG